MEFDDDPGSGSIWYIVMLVVIAVLMNAIAIFLLGKAFPPQRHASPAIETLVPATDLPAHGALRVTQGYGRSLSMLAG